jgi:ectoine hydroxylase-related dioxygenase (phytanoyl-CoA dioxygenase family)
MHAVHLRPTATPEEITAAMREHGYAIVDELVPLALMDQIEGETAEYVRQTEHGKEDFSGLLTKRTGRLIVRSAGVRTLVTNPTALGVAKAFLSKASTFQLNIAQLISVYPGSKAQLLHRDESVWDFFPFPADYEVQCNVLWAKSDYTAQMGATRVVPGSHLLPERDYAIEESIPAEMRRGSALFYGGKVAHGAGQNRSDRVRQAVNITYAVGWVRQEENQYLTTPLEIAKTLPRDLLRLMGYRIGCFPIGYVNDFEDPMSVIDPTLSREAIEIDLETRKHIERPQPPGADT